jgi:hypothetical protein
MLHDFMHIISYISKNPAEIDCLSCYLYRKQHEDVSFQTNYRANNNYIDK